MLGPPEPRRSRRRRGAWALVVGLVVLGVAGLIGSFLWVRSQYYVGEDAGQVVVFRGVDGAVLGLQLSSVQEGSCEPGLNGCEPLLITDLVPAARNQVVNGITAGTLDDARGVIARLSGQMLPACPTVTANTPQVLPPTTSAPSASPSGSGTPTAFGSVTGTAALTPIPPTPPAVTGSELLPVSTAPSAFAGTELTGTELTGTELTGTGLSEPALENTAGSVPASGSGTASGSPLPTRAAEPGVTCRVVR
jgi:protein phosphatase